MKLSANQPAPLFRTSDVYGNEIDLQKMNGKKVYLAFERNAGCPVCNLRTHQLLKHAPTFAAHNVMVVMVYESPREKLKDYLEGNYYPFHFVADPSNTLYNRYGVQRSMLKVMRGLFNGLLGKVKQGNSLFKKPMKQDGHLDRIPAEFIIENGKVSVAHYGRFVGDHLPMETLLAMV